jgi:hypothetical protein
MSRGDWWAQPILGVEEYNADETQYPHFISHHLGSDLHDCPTTEKDKVFVGSSSSTHAVADLSSSIQTYRGQRDHCRAGNLRAPGFLISKAFPRSWCPNRGEFFREFAG